MNEIVYFSLIVCCFSTFLSGVSFMDAILKIKKADEIEIPKLAIWCWYISLGATCAVFIGISL